MRKRDAKNAAKAAGIEWIVKSRNKHVEARYDDCGSDVSAIADDEYRKGLFVEENTPKESHYIFPAGDRHTHTHFLGIEQFALLGPRVLGLPDTPLHVTLEASIHTFFSSLAALHQGENGGETTYLEFCKCQDGTGRVTYRHSDDELKADAMTITDFTDSEVQEEIFGYFNSHTPSTLVLIADGQDKLLSTLANRQASGEAHMTTILQLTHPYTDGFTNQLRGDWNSLASNPRVQHIHAGVTDISVYSICPYTIDALRQSRGSPTDSGHWTWNFAVVLAHGLSHQYSFPEIETQTDEVAPDTILDQAWTFPGCAHNEFKGSPTHNLIPGECKHAEEIPKGQRSQPRTGAHPRAGRVKARGDPSAGLPGTVDGVEIGDAEEQAAALQPASSTSDTGATAGSIQPGGPSYDSESILRALRCTSANGMRKLLRKLHLRWWHATVPQMQHTLKQAQQPKQVLDLVPEVVEACEICRAWKRPMLEEDPSLGTSSLRKIQPPC